MQIVDFINQKLQFHSSMKFQEFMDRSVLMAVYKSYWNHLAPLQKTLKKSGLNLNESLVLLAVFFEGSSEVVTPKKLVETLGLTKDQISHALKGLIDQNYINVGAGLSDRRQRQVKLRPSGKTKASQLVSLFESAEQRLEDELGIEK